MNPTTGLAKKKDGQRLVNAERQVLISKLIDKLCEGYMSTNSLSKELGVSRATIETYRPLADELIGKMKLDRNVIRNLQIRRTYELIESLMNDLKAIKISDYKDLKQVSMVTKSRQSIYQNIYKFSSHLALITGLNVETHVNIDPTKLVIIRSGKKAVTDRVQVAAEEGSVTDTDQMAEKLAI